jgi:hypothetical protein
VMAAPRQRRSEGKAALPPAKPYRATTDVTDGVCRLIRSVGKRVAEEDTDGLEQIMQLDAAVQEALAVAVNGLRRNYSDRAIGQVLGVTRQAVEQRWPRRTEARS